VFQLLHDRRHNVLMTRVSGTYVLDDIVVRDRAVARFVARHGLARGIMDLTGVDAVDLPMAAIVKRASEPPLLPGQMRVIVAPHDLTYGLTRIIAAHQLFNRNVEPFLVRTLDEGYRLLELVDPRFEPVEDDEAPVLHDAMARALARIDAGADELRSADTERQALRDKMLRLLDTVLLRPAAQPLREPQVITLSDVLNTALSSARVSDGDIKAACRDCGKALSLGACRVVAGRETSYLCPSCRSVLVVLAPLPEGVPPAPEDGYPLGSFLVRPLVDLECRGARLPECPGALRASRPAAGRTG
jgi:hypothetical protein